MTIEDKLFSTVAKSLNIKLDISAHAVIRYMERMLKLDLKLMYFTDASKDKTKNFHGRSKTVSDNKLIGYVLNKLPNEYEIAMDHLEYITRGRVSSFTEDGIEYKIRDLNLITVYEKK